MRNKISRFIGLMVILFVITLVPMKANAGTVDGNLDYTFEDGTLTLSLASGCDSTTIRDIPSGVTKSDITSVVINTGFTSISYMAFYDCSSIKSITIPNSVTEIGWNAFENCSSLKNITIPNRITSIEGGLFENCSSLESVTIPTGVTSIGIGSFQNCSSLKSITIPNSVTDIGGSAFENCSSIKSITIPNRITRIGSRAFAGCSSLKSITIPQSLRVFGKKIFEGCSSLEIIRIPYEFKDIDINIIDHWGIPSSTKIIYYDDACSHTNTVTKKTKATVKADGVITVTCSGCKKELSRTKIPRAYVKYDKKAVYTRKAIKPIKIVDVKGKAISSSNYSISYKNNTKAGKATATVTFKNNYSGANDYSFEIVPKNTSIVSLKATTKVVTVTWKKVSTDFSGYQIQYATSSTFKSGANTVTVKSKSATSKTISSLKSGKNYYVRIRVYKTVSGKNYYSDWSDAKKIKVK